LAVVVDVEVLGFEAFPGGGFATANDAAASPRAKSAVSRTKRFMGSRCLLREVSDA
jgi:hypothetical protein